MKYKIGASFEKARIGENERKYTMNEKTAVKNNTVRKHRLISLEDVGWTSAGLLLELGSSALSPAPSGAALAAGLSGKSGLCAIVGGLAGALLHGFPSAIAGLVALALVFAVRLIPDFGKPKLKAAVRSAGAAAATVASRLIEVGNATELLRVILAGLSAGVFALCVCLISDGIKNRGFDVADTRDCALACVVTGLAFMSLGALDYLPLNVGRLLLGFGLLVVSAGRGLGMCAAVGISGIMGLCAHSPEVGAGGAIFAFAAVASMFFARYNKVVRAVGFAFLCVTAALITGIDEGSWRILVEAAIAAAVYAVTPINRAALGDGEFADSSVSYMLRERLNFAADAIAGIGAGLKSAAETLDRKYKISPEEIPDRAADRCCRSCPNSMVCWGKNYELFNGEFMRLAELIRAGGSLNGESLSPECAEICVNPRGVMAAITAEYSRFVSVRAGERRIRELRRIYVDQLEGMRDILHDMGSAKSEIRSGSRCRAAERRAEKILRDSGVELPQAFVMFDRRGKLRFEAYGATEPRVTYDYLGALLSQSIGRELETPQLSGGGGRYRFTASERTALSVKVGAYQIPRGENRVCGDCYEYFTDSAGVMYVILSDGMGNGSRARVDSAMACSVLSKLIKCGVSIKTALETVNTVLMVKSADESFATLDICRIDLNSGEGVVYKAGAATTYIKSEDKLVRAALSSAPAGLGGQLTVPAQKFTVGNGDVIVMMTDGAAPDEQWLSRELSQRADPAELSKRIAGAARMDKTRDDDISVITMVLGR